MITFENKLLVTNDINLALVQYGDIVCKDLMKAFIFPYNSKEVHSDLNQIWDDLRSGGSNVVDSEIKIHRYFEAIFEEANNGKKVALYYLYLNNSDYLEMIMERIELDTNLDQDEFEVILGRAIAEEIYYAENKDELYLGLIQYLVNYLCSLIKEFNQIDDDLDIEGVFR